MATTELTGEKLQEQTRMCQGVLEEYFKNNQVPLCSTNVEAYLDDSVTTCLLQHGHPKAENPDWLVNDRQNYDLGFVAEKALIEFEKEGKVFEGPSGKFKVRATYGQNSDRFFEGYRV